MDEETLGASWIACVNMLSAILALARTMVRGATDGRNVEGVRLQVSLHAVVPALASRCGLQAASVHFGF